MIPSFMGEIKFHHWILHLKTEILLLCWFLCLVSYDTCHDTCPPKKPNKKAEPWYLPSCHLIFQSLFHGRPTTSVVKVIGWFVQVISFCYHALYLSFKKNFCFEKLVWLHKFCFRWLTMVYWLFLILGVGFGFEIC